jgi:hypothetical protein
MQNYVQVHLNLKLVKFRVKLMCRWSNGEYEELNA